MNNDIEIFLKLKEELAKTFLQENIASSNDISSWKGQDIVNFQEELIKKVKGTISEKWFYNYFKNEVPEKLPRIDMLNLLAQYCGHKDWISYKHNMQNHTMNGFTTEESFSTYKAPLPILYPPKEEIKNNPIQEIESKEKGSPIELKINKPLSENIYPEKEKKSYSISVVSLALYISLFFAILFLSIWGASNYEIPFLQNQNTFTFCFIDADRDIPIKNQLDFTVLKTGESPIYFVGDENGCFKWKTKDKTLKLVVKSPYYKTDTIYRTAYKKKHEEKVELATDDYALMVQYFSNSNTKDWNNRRRELNRIIANDALIYQVFRDEQFGVEIYSKSEFINKLTLPTSSLKNLIIIDSEKENGRITKLKFEVNPAKK